MLSVPSCHKIRSTSHLHAFFLSEPLRFALKLLAFTNIYPHIMPPMGTCAECRRLLATEADLLSLFTRSSASFSAPAHAATAVGGYLSLSLHELSLFRTSCVLEIFVEKRHVDLLHHLRIPSSRSKSGVREQQPRPLRMQGGMHSPWEVVATCFGISKGCRSVRVWKCLFGFCLGRCDWRGLLKCISELPIHPAAVSDMWGRLKISDAPKLPRVESGHKGGRKKSVRLLQRVLSFLQQRRAGGESVFLDEMLLQQLARRGLFLEAGELPGALAATRTAAAKQPLDPLDAGEEEDAALARLLQRHAKAGSLFRKQSQHSHRCRGVDEMLPPGRLSPLHLFALRLCLSNSLPSVFISYLEHFRLARNFAAQQELKAVLRSSSSNETKDTSVWKDAEGTCFVPLSVVACLSPALFVALLAFIPQSFAALESTQPGAACLAAPAGDCSKDRLPFFLSSDHLQRGLSPFKELTRAFFGSCMQQEQHPPEQAGGQKCKAKLLLHLSHEEKDLLQQTAMQVALCNLLDEGVVSACLLFLELCGIDATLLRVPTAPTTDAAAAVVIQLFRDFPRSLSKSSSGSGISSPPLLSALRLLEEATWTLSAPPQKSTVAGNAAITATAMKGQAANPWHLVAHFCRAHELPHSLTLLHELARKGDWLSVLHEAELQRCPQDTLRGVIDGYFTNAQLRGHLKRAIGCSNTPVTSAIAAQESSSSWGVVEPLNLLIAAQQHQPHQTAQQGIQLLREALWLRRPRLAVYASCFSDCTVLQCFSIWLALQASQLLQTDTATAAASEAACEESLVLAATAETLCGLILTLANAGCSALVLRGFALFDPKSPLVDFLQFFRAFSQRRFHTAAAAIRRFVAYRNSSKHQATDPSAVMLHETTPAQAPAVRGMQASLPADGSACSEETQRPALAGTEHTADVVEGETLQGSDIRHVSSELLRLLLQAQGLGASCLQLVAVHEVSECLTGLRGGVKRTRGAGGAPPVEERLAVWARCLQLFEDHNYPRVLAAVFLLTVASQMEADISVTEQTLLLAAALRLFGDPPRRSSPIHKTREAFLQHLIQHADTAADAAAADEEGFRCCRGEEMNGGEHPSEGRSNATTQSSTASSDLQDCCRSAPQLLLHGNARSLSACFRSGNIQQLLEQLQQLVHPETPALPLHHVQQRSGLSGSSESASAEARRGEIGSPILSAKQLLLLQLQEAVHNSISIGCTNIARTLISTFAIVVQPSSAATVSSAALAVSAAAEGTEQQLQQLLMLQNASAATPAPLSADPSLHARTVCLLPRTANLFAAKLTRSRQLQQEQVAAALLAAFVAHQQQHWKCEALLPSLEAQKKQQQQQIRAAWFEWPLLILKEFLQISIPAAAHPYDNPAFSLLNPCNAEEAVVVVACAALAFADLLQLRGALPTKPGIGSAAGYTERGADQLSLGLQAAVVALQLRAVELQLSRQSLQQQQQRRNSRSLLSQLLQRCSTVLEGSLHPFKDAEAFLKGGGTEFPLLSLPDLSENAVRKSEEAAAASVGLDGPYLQLLHLSFSQLLLFLELHPDAVVSGLTAQVVLGGRLSYLAQLLGRPLEQQHQSPSASDTQLRGSLMNASNPEGGSSPNWGAPSREPPQQQQQPHLPQGIWGEGLSKAALEVLVSLHLREFACSGESDEQPGLRSSSSASRRVDGGVERPFTSIAGIEEHDAELYTENFSVDADAYLLQPTGAAAAARAQSQEVWEALKAAAERNLLRLLQEALPNIRIRLKGFLSRAVRDTGAQVAAVGGGRDAHSSADFIAAATAQHRTAVSVCWHQNIMEKTTPVERTAGVLNIMAVSEKHGACNPNHKASSEATEAEQACALY
ncbi:hypothetical protein cyc_04998 [Cyclospora cayetanensis]|uniref:Uncharacterized protein n=1 Tax=Cyclospora cayetanensis TaxID=88456 RepID=A0A1D3D175_9EIME|nr:hypothetical protein cyc_04998 [Cyclospora cayetanensis]